MPKPDIVADGFHVCKLINDALNKAWTLEKQQADTMSDKTDKKHLSDVLSKSKYVLLKSTDKLNDDQWEKLNAITENFPVLAKIYDQKEALRNIFDTHFNWTKGAFYPIDWMQDTKET